MYYPFLYDSASAGAFLSLFCLVLDSSLFVVALFDLFVGGLRFTALAGGTVSRDPLLGLLLWLSLGGGGGCCCRLFVCLFACLLVCLLVCLFACLLVCLFACLLVCLFACLLVFLLLLLLLSLLLLLVVVVSD